MKPGVFTINSITGVKARSGERAPERERRRRWRERGSGRWKSRAHTHPACGEGVRAKKQVVQAGKQKERKGSGGRASKREDELEVLRKPEVKRKAECSNEGATNTCDE